MNENTIRLYGPIGGFFGFTAEEILSQIPDDAKEVTIRIHSPGGIVGEGVAIANALRDHPSRITTIVDGDAHSIASVVMLAGDVIKVHKSSRVLIHNPWTIAEGNARQLREVADRLDETGDVILQLYKDKTGMDEDELRTLMEKERYMAGPELVAKGFADSIIDDPEAENAIAAMLRTSDLVSAQAREAVMSVQRTRKEIESERDELKTIVENHAAELDEATTQAALANERADAVTVEFDAYKHTSAEELERVKADLKNVAGQVELLMSENKHAEAELAKMMEELAQAKAALANPATTDATMVAHTIQDMAAADAEADAEEARADKGTAEDASVTPHYDEFCRLRDDGKGREATAYWNKHTNEIRQEQVAAIQDDGEEG